MTNTNKIIRSTLLAATFTLFSGCSGNSDSGLESSNHTATASGVFLDSHVEGLAYTSGDITGFTDAAGTFIYELGEAITFFIGGIELGTAAGGPLITPVDIVPDAVDASNEGVVNILRFLQTLDADAISANGIQITEGVQQLAEGFQATASQLSTQDFEVIAAQLTSATEIGARVLVDAATAIAHFQNTLASIRTQGIDTDIFDRTETVLVAFSQSLDEIEVAIFENFDEELLSSVQATLNEFASALDGFILPQLAEKMRVIKIEVARLQSDLTGLTAIAAGQLQPEQLTQIQNRIEEILALLGEIAANSDNLANL